MAKYFDNMIKHLKKMEPPELETLILKASEELDLKRKAKKEEGA